MVKQMMPFDYVCVSISFLPDSSGACLSQLFILIFVYGFFFIVLTNKRYRFMIDWFILKFGKWF